MRIFFTLLFLLLSYIPISANDSIATWVFTEPVKELSLNRYADILWDTSSNLTFHDVYFNPKIRSSFLHKDTMRVLGTRVKGTYWRRIILVNKSGSPLLFQARCNVDSLWVYEIAGGSQFESISGTNIKPALKTFTDPTGSVPVFLNNNEEKTYYFRIKEKFFPPSGIWGLNLINYNTLKSRIAFTYFHLAVLLVLLLVSLLLYYIFKDWEYLFLALPILGLLVWFSMNNHVIHQILDLPPEFNQYDSHLFHAWFMPATFLFFLTYYLNLKKKIRWAHYGALFIIVALALGFWAEIFITSLTNKVGNWVVLVMIIFTLSISTYLSIKGDHKARIWLLFMLPIICAGLIFLFNILFIPIDLGITSMQLLQIGSLISSLIIGYALYDRINTTVRDRISAIKEKEQVVRQQNIILERKVVERTEELMTEKEKSERILLNILPQEVADELKATGSSEARLYDHVTVLFTDFVDFTKAGEKMTAKQLVNELHNCFKGFDQIITSHGLEKIKTVGDAYIAVAGLPVPQKDHAERVVKAALDIRSFMAHRWEQQRDKTFMIRIGLHSGSVVAGIVGVKKFAYDIWGDTVNTAARMEQHSDPGQINISEITYKLINGSFDCISRGHISAKNKGNIPMYFVNRYKDPLQRTQQ